jgi:predicted PurR-regulated permease PerM
MVSSLLPISVVWVATGNIWYPLGVVAVFAIVQYLEANVIFPKVVGAQIKVNTLAMLIAMVCGGILWGMAGLILFIPFVAIIQIVSGHIEPLHPLHRLLGRT